MGIRQESPEQIAELTEKYKAEIESLIKNLRKDFIYSSIKIKNEKDGQLIYLRVLSAKNQNLGGNRTVFEPHFLPYYSNEPTFYYNTRVSQFDNRTQFERTKDEIIKSLSIVFYYFQDNFLFVMDRYGDKFDELRKKALLEDYQKLQVVLENRSIDYKKTFTKNAEMALKQAPKLERQRIKLWYDIPKRFGEGAVSRVLDAYCAYMEGRKEADTDVEIKFIKKLESMSGLTSSPLIFIEERLKKKDIIKYGLLTKGTIKEMKQSILKHQIESRKSTMTNPDHEYKKINQALNKPYGEGSDKLKGAKREDYLKEQRYVLLMNSIDYIDED